MALSSACRSPEEEKLTCTCYVARRVTNLSHFLPLASQIHRQYALLSLKDAPHKRLACFSLQHMMRVAQNSAGEDCFSSDYEEDLAQVGEGNCRNTQLRILWELLILVGTESVTSSNLFWWIIFSSSETRGAPSETEIKNC